MAYIPPHKRQSNTNPTTPSSPPISSSRNRSLKPNPFCSKSYHKNFDPSRKVAFSPHSVSRLYCTSSQTANLSLVPYNCETLEMTNGVKPLTLTVSDEAGPTKEEEISILNGIVEKVVNDLEVTSRHARDERENAELFVKLSVVARVGKILVTEKYKSESECLDSIRSVLTNEDDLNKQIHKSFNTDMSDEYMKIIEELLVQKCGFQFESEKDNYLVIVFDKDQPDSSVPCKCIVSPEGNLVLYKAELKRLRYMVTDISCLHKDFDLRIMLNTKRVLKKLDADVANGIDKLIKAAVINPKVKGGLTWPLGKESFSKRFFVTGFWHLKYKNLQKEETRVCLRNVDRFDQKTSKGEVSNEVTFKLKGVSEVLSEGNIVTTSTVDMIQDAVELIWENFLSDNSF